MVAVSTPREVSLFRRVDLMNTILFTLILIQNIQNVYNFKYYSNQYNRFDLILRTGSSLSKHIPATLFKRKETLETSNDVSYEAIDKALNDLFLKQSEEDILPDRIYERADINVIKKSTKQVYKSSKNIVENLIQVSSPIPVELVHQGRVVFGNFISKKVSSNAVKVRLSSGEIISTDLGQIISVWDQLADDVMPKDIASWSDVVSDALELLGNLSPRKSDLNEFWKLVSQRSNALVVDSQDLAIYIFQERKFRKWVDPYADPVDSNVNLLFAAQRYAAALLLYNDQLHFKRRPSTYQTQPIDNVRKDTDNVRKEVDDDGINIKTIVQEVMNTKERVRSKKSPMYETVLKKSMESSNDKNEITEELIDIEIIEGGYKVLEESIIFFKECEIFYKYYQYHQHQNLNPLEDESKQNPLNPFEMLTVSKYLRALEVYSMSMNKLPPPKDLKMCLKKMNKSPDPKGAMQLLAEMNHDTQSKVKSPNKLKVMLIKKPSMDMKNANNSSKNSNEISKFYNSSPWSKDVLNDALKLKSELESRRQEMMRSDPSKVGKAGLFGKLDFRGCSTTFPPFCIDNKQTAFYDDAYSIHPDTGEVLIHVVDVVEVIRRYENLLSSCKDRLSSAFLHSGPLHMLPPQALEGLKLSSVESNEVITVALLIDPTNGELVSHRIFPSVIGPVIPFDIETANEIIDGVGIVIDDQEEDIVEAVESNLSEINDLDIEDVDGMFRVMDENDKARYGILGKEMYRPNEKSHRLGLTDAIVRELRAVQRITDKLIETYPEIEQQLVNDSPPSPTRDEIESNDSGDQSNFIYNRMKQLETKKGGKIHYVKKSNRYEVAYREVNPATRIVNTLLTLYSNVSVEYCRSHYVPIPIVWDNRDKVDNTKIRRFATQPLRNWLAIQQQKQIRAALRMELPLSREQCALSVVHYNNRRKEQSSLVSKGREQMAFEYFHRHFLDNGKDSEKDIYVTVEGLGRGGLVRIHSFNVNGIVINVQRNIEVGEIFPAIIKKVNADTRTIFLHAVE